MYQLGGLAGEQWWIFIFPVLDMLLPKKDTCATSLKFMNNIHRTRLSMVSLSNVMITRVCILSKLKNQRSWSLPNAIHRQVANTDVYDQLRHVARTIYCDHPRREGENTCETPVDSAVGFWLRLYPRTSFQVLYRNGIKGPAWFCLVHAGPLSRSTHQKAFCLQFGNYYQCGYDKSFHSCIFRHLEGVALPRGPKSPRMPLERLNFEAEADVLCQCPVDRQ